jgi:pilus assembly protein FimV
VRKIIFALALGAILVPDYGFTLGLGEIEVTTALNQELNAEIELLSAAPEDVETLIVKLASREEFSRAGIDRPYMLNSLRFVAEMRDGVPYIRVTSNKPVREPFLNFLVEVDWPKGHMMREYTILLDPPVFMEQQAPVQQEQMRPAAMESSRAPVSEAAPEPQSSSGFRPAAMGVTAGTTSTVAVPVPNVQTTQDQAMPYQAPAAYTQSYQQPPGGHRIQQGDTLWSLADAMRPDQSVTIEQMMLAMLRSNPEAFINENVNGLKRGYILRIPDRDDIVVMNQAEAVALVREQNALWREYQQAVTGGEPASAMDIAAQDDAGADLDESTDSRLEIVAAGSGTSATGSKDATQMSSSELRAELALARESLETERVEKEELQQRVSSLEGQVDRMKSLLTLEDSDMAEMQQAATPVAGEAMPDAGFEEEVAVEELADLAAEEMLMDDDVVLEDTMLEDVAIDEVGVEEDAETQVFIDEEQLEAVEELAEQSAAPTEDLSVAPYTEPEFMPSQIPGPIAALLNNPVLLAAAGGGLLLVLLLVALIMKRRKSGDEEQIVTSNLEDIAGQFEDSDVIREVEDTQVEQEMAAAEAETVEQETDTESATVSPSAEDTVVTPAEDTAEESRDDIIAEADVYLAYGIYQQAEELLQNAIKNNPENDNYRVKLAETYSAGKNADAFIELATEVNQRRNGEDTPAWQKIVAIGKQLVPDHALISGAAVGDLSMDDLASRSPEAADVELGSEAEQEAIAPDLDLSFDEPEAEVADEVTSQPTELVDSVEFDLAETGAETIADLEGEDEGVAFDLTETQAFESGTETGEFSLDIEASELGIDEAEAEIEAEVNTDDEFDLDLSAQAEAALAADDEDAGGEISLDDIDEASLDLDIGSDEAGVTTEPAAEESQPEEPVAEEPKAVESMEEAADIIDFAERAMEEHAVEAQAESASFADSMDDDLDLSDLDDIDEVSTKLDLAKAYLDMGDADGTRSILDEVMTEGNDDQKREADDLLRQLG